jgi:hypothetical protein
VGPNRRLGKRPASGQVEGAALLLNTLWVDPLVGGVGSFVSETASWAAFAASVFAAAALLLSRRAGWLNMAVW